MSNTLMLLIAVIYMGAAFSFAGEAKWGWAVVALCWGIGNAVLAYLSK